MSSQKLSPADRKEAKETIEKHFETLLEIDIDQKTLSNNILRDIRRKHKDEIREIVSAKKLVRDLEKKLEKRLPDGMELSEYSTKIQIDTHYQGEYRVCKSHVESVRKKNKPVEKKRRQALASLQTTENRSELETLFVFLGIL